MKAPIIQSTVEKDSVMRAHLVKLLRGGQAYQPLSVLLQDLSAETAGKTVPHLPYTIWQLVDHMRYTLADILDFIQNPNYQEPTWPDDYWPKEKAPANQAALDKSIKAISTGMEKMIELVQDSSNDLFEALPHGDGQTLLREALLVAEHNAYHVGEVIVLRRLLGDWE